MAIALARVSSEEAAIFIGWVFWLVFGVSLNVEQWAAEYRQPPEVF